MPYLLVSNWKRTASGKYHVILSRVSHTFHVVVCLLVHVKMFKWLNLKVSASGLLHKSIQTTKCPWFFWRTYLYPYVDRRKRVIYENYTITICGLSRLGIKNHSWRNKLAGSETDHSVWAVVWLVILFFYCCILYMQSGRDDVCKVEYIYAWQSLLGRWG